MLEHTVLRSLVIIKHWRLHCHRDFTIITVFIKTSCQVSNVKHTSGDRSVANLHKNCSDSYTRAVGSVPSPTTRDQLFRGAIPSNINNVNNARGVFLMSSLFQISHHLYGLLPLPQILSLAENVQKRICVVVC